MWKLRYLIGGLCLCAAVMFLSINSLILSRGAFRLATLPVDQWSYAIVAWMVPWVIAVMPFVTVWCCVQRRWGWATASVGVYVLFIAYNISGSTEATALIRGDALGERQHAVVTDTSRRDRRAALVAQRDAIAKSTRPAAQIKGLIEVQHANRTWQDTDGCREISNNRERKWCAAYAALQAEAGAALRLEQTHSAIEAIDTASESAGPAVVSIDPNAAFLAGVMGWDERTISRVLNLRTPIVLEIGAMFLLGFAFVAFGLSHKAVVLGQRSATPLVTLPDVAGGEKVAALPPATTLTQQLDLVQWFFGAYSRPVSDGFMAESRWYELYLHVCAQSNSAPLPLDGFRRQAKRYIPDQPVIDGKVTYRGFLPLVPKGAVA